MLIQNNALTFDWVLTKSASFATYNEAYFDIQVTAPDGTVTYSEGANGAGWTTTFTQSTATVDGQLTYAYTPTQLGIYTIILGTGGATSFTILDTVLALIVKQDSTVNNTVILA